VAVGSPEGDDEDDDEAAEDAASGKPGALSSKRVRALFAGLPPALWIAADACAVGVRLWRAQLAEGVDDPVVVAGWRHVEEGLNRPCR
jgi:hypothetical protein